MNLSRLVDADERLDHQIVDTFANVVAPDLSWTEKIWGSFHPRGTGTQLGFGLGKYSNRGIMDGFGGLARGNAQWVVRSSREVGNDPSPVVGRVRYEVIEPFKSIRFVLDPGSDGRLGFDVTMHCDSPAGLEARWPWPNSHGFGLRNDVVRYHQAGVASGWFVSEGDRTDFSDAETLAFRDHSWGFRAGIGEPASDVMPRVPPVRRYRIWMPSRLMSDDQGIFGLFIGYLREEFDDGQVATRAEAVEEWPDGRRTFYSEVTPHLTFDPSNRRCLGGTIELTRGDASVDIVELRPASDTGFYIGAAGYYGAAGHRLGSWHGRSWEDSVHIADTNAPEVAAGLGQTRDLLVEMRLASRAAVGHGVIESIVDGPHPSLNLHS